MPAALKEITPERALADYLALPKRSVEALRAQYEAQGITVSLSTLQKWCRRGRWRAQARRVAVRTAEKVTEKAAASQAQQLWSAVESLDRLARNALDRAAQIAKTHNNLTALVDVSIKALQQREVMQGRVSDRVEQLTEAAADDNPVAKAAHELLDRLGGGGEVSQPHGLSRPH